MGGRACLDACSQRWQLGPAERAQAHGAQKANLQGWGHLQAQVGRSVGTGHARTSGHGWRPRASCLAGTAELETSTTPGQAGAESPGLSLSRAWGLWV